MAMSRGKSCATSIWKCEPEKWWRWWDRVAPAKSTLVHLIPRFFDVTAGRLLIDGRDVRDTTLSSLRSQIGVVTQETVAFQRHSAQQYRLWTTSISQNAGGSAARAPWRTTLLWRRVSLKSTVSWVTTPICERSEE